MTRYELHVQTWSDCTGCELHTTRKHVCIGRGTIPSDIVFIAEAPGFSEDTLGVPFIGPAGKLLDQILERAVPSDVTYAMTNLVGCIPLDPEDRSKFSEPPDDCIEACSGRLKEFIDIADPKLIICVGVLARDWLDVKLKNSIKLDRDTPMEWVKHPSAILRMPYVTRGLEIQRCEVAIRNAVLEYVLGE